MQEIIDKIYRELKNKKGGELPTYIPELATADPKLYSIVIVTCDGVIYKVGDYNKHVPIESISKVFTLCLALKEYNITYLLKNIGTQTSFLPFNSVLALKLSKSNTINPFVNAGAIATTSLIKGNKKQINDKILNNMSDFANRKLKLRNDVYQSESQTDSHNMALAYLLKSMNKIHNDVPQTVNIYTKQCSVNVTAIDLAVMAATFANGGVNPLSKKKLMNKSHVSYVLSTMMAGGLYNYSGTWINTIGIPGKSGVGGGLIGVVPGEYGIAVISPPLDQDGNSYKGILTFEKLEKELKFNMFRQ